VAQSAAWRPGSQSRVGRSESSDETPNAPRRPLGGTAFARPYRQLARASNNQLTYGPDAGKHGTSCRNLRQHRSRAVPPGNRRARFVDAQQQMLNQRDGIAQNIARTLSSEFGEALSIEPARRTGSKPCIWEDEVGHRRMTMTLPASPLSFPVMRDLARTSSHFRPKRRMFRSSSAAINRAGMNPRTTRCAGRGPDRRQDAGEVYPCRPLSSGAPV